MGMTIRIPLKGDYVCSFFHNFQIDCIGNSSQLPIGLLLTNRAILRRHIIILSRYIYAYTASQICKNTDTCKYNYTLYYFYIKLHVLNWCLIWAAHLALIFEMFIRTIRRIVCLHCISWIKYALNFIITFYP